VGEDHGMPDLEVCDGCPSTVASPLLFPLAHSVLNCQEDGGEEEVAHPTMEQPTAWPPSNAWFLFWGTCQGQVLSVRGTSDPSVAACHRRHHAITCATGSPRFILSLAGPCEAVWACRVVRSAEEQLLSPLVFLFSPSSLLIQAAPSCAEGSQEIREAGKWETRDPLDSPWLCWGGLNMCESCGWSEFWVLCPEAWISVWISKLL